MSNPRRTFTPGMIESVQHSMAARKRYLQTQAAAWTILTEQHRRGVDGPNERAKGISLACIRISSTEEWRRNRILVQEYLAVERGESLGLEICEGEPSVLITDVCEQLKLYAKKNCERYWNSYLEILLDDAVFDLERFDRWIGSIMWEAGDDFSQAEMDWNFRFRGLPTCPIPRKAVVAIEKANCWTKVKGVIARLRACSEVQIRYT